MIDHEQWKLKIKLSSSTYNLINQDMYRFGFVKKNNIANTNYFINRILPIIYSYRMKQDERFLKILEKKFLNILSESNKISKKELIQQINNFYYEDEISYHEEEVNLRISNDNMDLFSNVIEDDFERKMKKSTFFRSLINQYSNFKLDIREFLCFNKEYHKIEDAIENNNVIKFVSNGENVELIPKRIYTCPITSDIYIFGLIRLNSNTLVLKSYRIFEILNLHIIQKSMQIINQQKIEQEIDNFVINLEYLDTKSKEIGDK